MKVEIWVGFRESNRDGLEDGGFLLHPLRFIFY